MAKNEALTIRFIANTYKVNEYDGLEQEYAILKERFKLSIYNSTN